MDAQLADRDDSASRRDRKQSDDWRDSTQLRLAKTHLYQLLKSKCATSPCGPQTMSLIDDAAEYCTQRTKLVVRHLKEYTLHDEEHLFRVLFLMDKLTPNATLENLSVPELMLLVLAAFFHDIGMTPAEDDVRSWLSFWDEKPLSARSQDFDAFALFVKARPDKLAEITRLRNNGLHGNALLLQEYLVAEFIRSTHADRARTIIEKDWGDKIVFRDTNLAVELALICFSHADNPVALLELDSSHMCGPDIFACLPFVGVLLRLADIVDFDAKRTPKILFSHIGVRHPVSLLEWKKHRQIQSWHITPKKIAFNAQCEHPAIEAAIHRFCDLIDRELVSCTSVLQNITDPGREPFPDWYRIALPTNVDRKRIQTKKDIRGNPLYRYKDCQFRLNHTQVIDLLMGTSLYGNPAVAIRELVQNSIDACLVRQALEAKWGNAYHPEIIVEFIRTDSGEVLKVTDNGIGMDQHIIDKYYSTIGASFYRSGEFYSLQAANHLNFHPISRFGIGVLSCFMVADSIRVQTRRLLASHNSGEPLEIRIEGVDSLFWILTGNREQPGTETELLLRADHPWKELDDKERLSAIRALFPNPPFPIGVQGLEEEGQETGERFHAEIEPNWIDSHHVRQFNISLKHPVCGLAGQAAIGILQDDNKFPVLQKTLFIKNITVEGDDEVIELSTMLNAGVNAIERESDSLEVRDDTISKRQSSSDEVESEAEFAVHGISMPMNLFPNFWAKQNQKTRLVLPFPMKIRVDVVALRDLNLNSARNLVVFDERWNDFVETLYFVICKELRAKVSVKYWNQLIQNWNALFQRDKDLAIFMKAAGKMQN
jgi:molecular chaperone HtpG